MSAWWWACQDEGILIRESADDDARPPEHDHRLQLVSPAIAAALRERERLAKEVEDAETENKLIRDIFTRDEQNYRDKLDAALRERERMREDASKIAADIMERARYDYPLSVPSTAYTPANGAKGTPVIFGWETLQREIIAALAPAAPKDFSGSGPTEATRPAQEPDRADGSDLAARQDGPESVRQEVNQDRPPNFRTKDGRLYLVRCFACGGERGTENYAMAVSSGTCSFCGWSQPAAPKEKP